MRSCRGPGFQAASRPGIHVRPSEGEPLEVLGACKDALEVIGKRFETGEAFLPELMMAGEMMQEISALVKPKLQGGVERKFLGRVTLGTVAGDVHDIGKNIVSFLLDAHGLEVIDLGVDVPPSVFVEKTRETGARVVALSGLLTLAFDSMKGTVEAISAAGLRGQVKITVGGAPVNEQVNSPLIYAPAAMRQTSGCSRWNKLAAMAWPAS